MNRRNFLKSSTLVPAAIYIGVNAAKSKASAPTDNYLIDPDKWFIKDDKSIIKTGGIPKLLQEGIESIFNAEYIE